MVNRFVISPTNGVRLSRPGYDVLTCADENLLISDKGSAFNVYMMGSVSVPGYTNSSTFTTINYGTSFSSLPLVFCYYVNGGVYYNCQYMQAVPPVTSYWPEIGYRVYVNKLELYNHIYPIAALTVYYKVWSILF